MIEKIMDIMDVAEDAMSLTDRDWYGGGPHILYVNKKWEKLTGYKMEEVFGENPKILQGPKTVKSDLSGFRESVENNKIFHCSTWNHKKNGEPFRVEMIVFNLGDIKDYYIAIQRDITMIDSKNLSPMKANELKTLMKIINL